MKKNIFLLLMFAGGSCFCVDEVNKLAEGLEQVAKSKKIVPPLPPRASELEKEMKDENFKVAWKALKEKDIAGFYKIYQKHKDFFEKHSEARKILIKNLEVILPQDQTKFSPGGLKDLGEKISQDIGDFIGREQYLYEKLNEIQNGKNFVDFLKSKEGKPFRDALVLMLSDKSSMTIGIIEELARRIEPYLTLSSEKSKQLKPYILATLQGSFDNALVKLKQEAFYNPQKTIEMEQLINFFKNQVKDSEFAQFLSDSQNIRFALFLSSNEPEAKLLLEAITRFSEKNDENLMKKLRSIRAAIDTDVADEIVKTYLMDNKKIPGFIARINKGFNLGQLKNQWPWQGEEVED